MNQQRTKIVCTLGPASDNPVVLRQMIKAGVDVFRLNASHGKEKDHMRRVAKVRAASRDLGQPVGILLDLPGPKLRLGKLTDEKMILRKGDIVRLVRPNAGRASDLPLRNPEILNDLKPGHEIYLADGTVQLVAEKHETGAMRCRVQVGGTIRSGSGLNLPDTDLSGAVPTPIDREWIKFARTLKVDWLAISFVQTARDVENVRKLAGFGPEAPRLVAKIEKRNAVKNLESIIKVTDAVMVARGDLGVETPLSEIPMAQKKIIGLANLFGKPVITATQMLESMVDHPTPTRAEVTDVANAILDGTDAVMLSAESAIGQFPVQSAATLARVAQSTEMHYPYQAVMQKFAVTRWTSLTEAASFSAVRMANDTSAKAILVSPSTNTNAASIARFRPEAPVILLSHTWEEACRQTLPWGVVPLVVPKSWKLAVPIIKRELRKTFDARRGTHVVMVQSAPLDGMGSDILRIVTL